MLANRTSRWSIGAALLCAALLAASWFLLISPRRADATDLRGKTEQATSQASSLQLQIAQLKSEFDDLDKRRDELAAIKTQLPGATEMPTLIRTLRTTSDRSGMVMQSLTPGTPVVVTGPGQAAPPVPGAGSLVSLPITMVVEGDYFEASLYLKNLQTRMTRAFLVTGLDAKASTPAVTASPTPTVTVAATVTATPTTTATATATPTPTVAATVAEPDLSYVSLTVTGSIFVLLDGTVTLDDVSTQVKAAAGATAAGNNGAAAGTTGNS